MLITLDIEFPFVLNKMNVKNVSESVSSTRLNSYTDVPTFYMTLYTARTINKRFQARIILIDIFSFLIRKRFIVRYVIIQTRPRA